ncbi:MAG: flagellar biosynthetic protein FliO [Bacillota bacterium]
MTMDLIGAVLRLVVALPLTILLIYVCLHFLAAAKPVGWTGKRRMRVIEQLPLGGKSRISLVRVGDAYYLLGHGENGTTLLKEFQDLPEAFEWTPIQGGFPERLSIKPFLHFLRRTAKRSGEGLGRPPGE